MSAGFNKDLQFYKFCLYGFLKNQKFYEPFFLLFLLSKDISYLKVGILYGIKELVVNILEIPGGIIADSVGRKRTMIISLIFYCISFITFYFSESYTILVVAIALFGIGDVFRTGTHKAMIYDYLGTQGWDDMRVYYYGHTRSWSMVGSALSALMAGFIVLYGGSYDRIFLYSIVPYALNLILILSYPESLNRTLDPDSNNKITRMGQASRMLLSLLKQAKVLRLIYSSAIHTAYLRAVKDYIQLVMINLAMLLPFLIHLEEEQKGGIFIGVTYFLIFLASAYASRFSSLLASRSRRNMTRLTLFVSFLFGTFSGMAFTYEFWLASLLAFAAIYVMENIRKPLLTGAIANEVPKEILTSVISAQSLLRTVMTALLALIFGIVADHFGIGISLFAISSLLLLSGLAITVKKS